MHGFDTGRILDSLLMLAIGGSFLATDAKSPATRALSLVFVVVGLDISVTGIHIALAQPYFNLSLDFRITSVLDVLSLAAAAEWLRRVAETGSLNQNRAINALLRVAQLTAIVFGVLEFALAPTFATLALERPGQMLTDKL